MSRLLEPPWRQPDASTPPAAKRMIFGGFAPILDV
jgi:uncharacterized protein YbaA (DUF1428 family)